MNKIFRGNPIKPAHFYMQKVLPLVYDESLSYYEAVDKLVHKLNEIIFVINDKLADYLRARLDELYLDAMYDAESETIILNLSEDEAL